MLKRAPIQYFTTLTALITSGLVLAGLIGCSPVSFSVQNTDKETPAITTNSGTPTDPSTSPSTPCSPSVEQIHRRTKILFLVDTSGSNAYDTVNTINGRTYFTPATDPRKDFRGGAISQFLEDYRHKTNFNWGFIAFADDLALAFINGGSPDRPVFANDASAMRSAIEAFYRKPDEGLTPYGAALRMAAAAINNDPDLNSPDSPTYDVIMISDGFPTDYSDRDGHFNEARMQQDLSALLQAATGRVSLSTIFYGQIEIPAAIDLLRALAQKGGGHFASVRDANSSFKIDDVIPNVGSCSP